MMKANKFSFAWLVNCKILLLLVVFALEVSTVKAGNNMSLLIQYLSLNIMGIY